MGGKGMEESVATCRFAKTDVCNSFLYRFLDHDWIWVVAAFVASGSILQRFCRRRAGRDGSGMDG